VLLPDRPGELTRVSSVIAKTGGNVIRLEHNQFVSINRQDAVELKITMEAFGTEHKQQILDTLEKNGYAPKIAQTLLS
jgi:threonine dehydratase